MNRCKSIILFCFLLLFLLLLVGACVFFQDNDCIKTVRIVYSANDDIEESVSLFENDGRYYAFLPSYTRLKNTYVTSENNYTIKLNDIVFDSNKNCAELELNKEYKLKITNLFGITLADERIVFMRSDNIPSLSIHLSNGTIKDINSDKKKSKKGVANLIEKNGTVNYSGSFKGIHGRGNSTWIKFKKSYAIKFSEATDLLNMGSGKNWVLLANSVDETNMKNKIVFDAAKALGVDYAIESKYVDLYIDSEYYGLYLLTERIDIEENHVNIRNLEQDTQLVNSKSLSSYSQVRKTEDNKIMHYYDIPNNPEDITGGYLLQVEHHDDQLAIEESAFQTNDLGFTISYPKYTSEKQIKYISTLINSIEKRIKKGNTSGIDLESFAKYYLIQEFFSNIDNSSCYFYKDNDLNDNRLKAGPIWDFDTSMFDSDTLIYDYYNWYNYLCDNSDFQHVRDKIYVNSLKPLVKRIINRKLDEYCSIISSSFCMDRVRWYNNSKLSDKELRSVLKANIKRISDFMTKRITFLDDVWCNKTTYYKVVFETTTPFVRRFMYAIKPGNTLSEIPKPPDQEVKFIGWYDYKTNEKFNLNQKITSNRLFIAKWEKTTYVDTIPSIKERIMLKLGDKQFVLVYSGMVFIFLIILIIGFKDARAIIKTRRKKNGKK